MKETVIQFGEGNFLRGFFNYFLHVMNEKGLYDGKAVVIQPRAGGKCALLNAQGCKYNLYLRGMEKGEIKKEHHLIESISRCIDPYKYFDEYISLADNPDFRFVVSNTTEAGIAFDESCSFDDRPCTSFPGKLTQLLYKRYKNGMKGFVFLPTELIDGNGDALKKCVLQYAELWKLEEGFIRWINEENTFLNTLVDRIVTGYPNDETAVLHPEDKYLDTAEVFHLWVIEGNFENELPLKKAGFNVVWADDAKPYKKIKVRILNGAHTSLVPYAMLSGFDTVKSCMDDEEMSSYVRRCVFGEIIPTLDLPRDELTEYAEQVLVRFSNPYIKHYLSSIALNTVSKFKVRVLPSILEYVKRYDKMPETLIFSFAKLIDFYMTDMTNDDPDVTAFMKSATVGEILANEKLWGEDLSFLESEVAKYVVNK